MSQTQNCSFHDRVANVDFNQTRPYVGCKSIMSIYISLQHPNKANDSDKSPQLEATSSSSSSSSSLCLCLCLCLSLSLSLTGTVCKNNNNNILY